MLPLPTITIKATSGRFWKSNRAFKIRKTKLIHTQMNMYSKAPCAH